MKRYIAALITVLLAVTLTVGCAQKQGIITRVSDNGEKPETPSSVTNIQPDGTGNNGTGIPDEQAQGLVLKEKFLNSIDGRNFQAVAWRFARAYLSSDVDAMKLYLTDPKSKVSSYGTDAFDNVELFILKLSPGDIKEETVKAEYEIGLKGQDTLVYLYLEMIKADDEWKVQSYGLEQ